MPGHGWPQEAVTMQSSRTSASKRSPIDGSFHFPTSEPTASRTDRRLPTDPAADLPGRNGHTARSARHSAEADDAHLLRLCLDLKLDALLLALGAAASDPTCAAPSGPTVGDPDVPSAASGAHAAAVLDRLIDLTTDPPSQRYIFRTPALGFSGPPGGSMTGTAASAADGSACVEPAVGPVPVPPWQRWLREDVEMAGTLARELLAWGGGLPSSLGETGTTNAAIAVLDRLEAFHNEMGALLGEVEAVADAAEAVHRPTGRIRTAIRQCRRRLTELGQLRLQLAELRAAETPGVSTARSLPGEFLG
jgi:hypothetical protein